MAMLAYYCATGYDFINVINGNGKGGPISTINDINCLRIAASEQEHIFLDSVTGDFYAYDLVRKGLRIL